MHDFIGANTEAVNEIKQMVTQGSKKCKNQAKTVKELKRMTESKLKEIQRLK